MILSKLNAFRRYLDKRSTCRTYRSKIARLLTHIPHPHISVNPRTMAVRRYSPHYCNTDWHVAYGTLSRIQSVAYLPEDLFYAVIEPALNQPFASMVYRDKICLSFVLREHDYVGNCFFRLAGGWFASDGAAAKVEVVRDWLAAQTEAVLKPAADSGGGRGVLISSPPELLRHIEATSHAVVLQGVFRQHPAISVYNRSSLNTIRLMTLRCSGEIRIISGVLRMGIDGSRVDNVTRGGVAVGIHEGRLRHYGMDTLFGRHECHPTSGVTFADQQVPSWNLVLDLAVRCHHRCVGTDIVSWDIAVGEDGWPRVIEANFRSQEISGHQVLNGPVFEPYLQVLFHSTH